MTNKKILLITGDKNFYGQSRKAWVPMDISLIKNRLGEYGYQVDVRSIQDVCNQKNKPENEIILYSFSQKDNVRQYIRDIITLLSKKNRIIPPLDLLFCHENKGYQELYKQEQGLTGLKAWYFTNLYDIDTYNIPYPVVLKTIYGSNGKGVYLIRNRTELEKQVKKLTDISLLTRLDLFRRRYFRKKTFADYPNYSDFQDYLQYKDYITKHENFILQEFVPNLKFDYRVLALEGIYFAMRRYTKKGDFRASGTKKFDFNFIPDNALLTYAEKVYNHFDNPFLSMDIVFNGQEYFLIEFQASHFGVSAITKSKGYYSKLKNQWTFCEDKSIVEYEIADSLIRYLKRTLES